MYVHHTALGDDEQSIPLPDFCSDAMHFSRLYTFAMNSSLISDHIAPVQKVAIAQQQR